MKNIKSISEFNVEDTRFAYGNLLVEKKQDTSKKTYMKQNKLLMVCVSLNSDSMYEIQYLRNACMKCDVNFIHVNFMHKENFVKVADGRCILCMGERMYELDKSHTVIVKRHAKMSNSNVQHSLNILKNNDFLIINSSISTAISGDKARTIKKFDSDGVSYPKSLIIDAKNIDDFDNEISSFNVKYPVIAKVNRGSQGNGVFIFDNPQSLKGVAQYIISHSDCLPCSSIIVQEKIEAEYDLRIHVLRKESDPTFRNGDTYEVFAAMKRNKIKGDYRSNASLGAEYEYYEPSADEVALAKKAAQSIGCAWCGVDIMRDINTKKLYVLEVNCTPSLKGITNVAEKDPATELVKALKEAFAIHDGNDNREKITLGYKETFYVNDFDMPLIGLLDTGNGSLTSLRVDNIKVDDDKEYVEWELFGKKFKTKYDGDVGYISSGGNRVEQPTTRVDISHDGIVYKNIRIKLSAIKGAKHSDNRVLNINRDLLSKMNAVVDTSKKHVNSTMKDIKKLK